MKLKNYIFEDLDTGFVSVVNKLYKMELPVLLSLSLLKFIKELEEKGNVYHTTKMGLYRKYGMELEKQPGIWKVKDENKEVFTNEFKQLLEAEETYTLEKVRFPEWVKISPEDIAKIEDIILIDPPAKLTA